MTPWRGIERTGAVNVILASIGASFVTVPALPGLVAERLRLCIINEATLVNEEGTASPEAIDTALTLGMNHPRGPFQMLADLGPQQVAGDFAPWLPKPATLDTVHRSGSCASPRAISALVRPRSGSSRVERGRVVDPHRLGRLSKRSPRLR